MDDIPEIGSKLIDFFGRTLHVVRGADGAPAVYMNVCVHFGGTMVCANGQFLCEWHGATFDAKTGACTGGPAEEDSRLMRLPAVVRSGVLTYEFAWGEDA